eukprot:scaffold58453_cov85-Phaeocystis_antarctica.AAC.4
MMRPPLDDAGTHLLLVLSSCSPIVRQVELPQRAAAPERFKATHQHVMGKEDLLQRRAATQRLEPARQLVVPNLEG